MEQSFLVTFFGTILFGHCEHLHEVYAKPVSGAVRGSMISQRRKNYFFLGGENSKFGETHFLVANRFERELLLGREIILRADTIFKGNN